MDHGTAIRFGQLIHSPSLSGDRDIAAEQRLARLLELNDAIARERSLYRNSRERLEASIMKRPVSSMKAYSYFGLIIGLFPPASIVLKLVIESTSTQPSAAVFLFLAVLASVMTGVVGYQLGKYVPQVVDATDSMRFPNRIACISLIGLVWGSISGAAGGLFLFVVGTFFAATIGAIVGAMAVPVFVLLHRLVRRGDLIELKHLLPISAAIVLSLCAFIFGL